MELATTISNQAAVAIQNARLYAETRGLTHELDQRVRDRTLQLEMEHRRAETLLRIITELSASLDLAQVLNSTLQVLNEILESEQIDVLFSRPGEREMQVLARLGGNTNDASHTRLAHHVIRQRQSVLMKDTQVHPLWQGAPVELQSYHSAMAVPLMVGAEVFGAILCFHTKPEHFSPGSLDLTQATANQVAVSVNNAELYRLIRDQAEDLGQMVRSQQIETQRTKEILESVADGVLVTNDTATITLFNDSAEWMLNLPRQRVLGKQLDDFTGLFGSAGQAWMETIQAWSEDPDSYQPGDTGRGSAYAEQIELDNGRVISVHLAPVRLRDNFLGTVSIFRDITHQVEVDRLKSEFVATVSHELRTPMTSIKGYVDLLLMGAGGELNEQQLRFLDIVKSNTERLAILVNDLLDISRIEAGRVQLSFQPLDLQEMGRKSIDDLKQRMQQEGKPMQIEFESPGYLPRVRGDMERIYQVLENLLENAYYYTPENGSIRLSVRAEGDSLRVDVSDNGIGVPPEMKTRVFERFYRGEHPFVLATSGTGLGLSIVQTLVEMHGGRIWLESAGLPGLGSTFSFTLPVYLTEKEEV
jgi:signal transduction histidine kinase